MSGCCPGKSPGVPARYPSYEEEFGPFQRRWQRGIRCARWHAKGLIGAPRTLLVEIRWRLGDEVMALPIYEALRRRWPNTRLVVWCHYPDVLENSPFVDAMNTPCPAPDRYILLRGARPDVFRLAEYARRARVPLPTVRPRLMCRDWSSPLLDQLPAGKGPLIAVSAGAGWPAKQWPMERWRALCEQLQAWGGRVVELGLEEEAIGVGTSLVGRTTVRDAARVLHAAQLLVCCDSGLMHLALAAGTPVVALFGPTEPSILVRDEPNLTAITTECTERGCWNAPSVRGRSLEAMEQGVCPRGMAECLDSISVTAVAARVRERISFEAD